MQTYIYELHDPKTGMKYIGSRVKAWLQSAADDVDYKGTVTSREYKDQWSVISARCIKSILKVWNYNDINEYQIAHRLAKKAELDLLKQVDAHESELYYNTKPGKKSG